MTTARAYVVQEFDLSTEVVTLTFGLFSVDDARKLIHSASISGTGGKKVIIARVTRIFHEAQNALLKILEEPPEGVTIILCVPSEGVFISTLRSRLLALPSTPITRHTDASPFISLPPKERETHVAKIIERSKSDKDEVKQVARREALEVIQSLTTSATDWLHTAKSEKERAEAVLLLEDLTSFTPILYERSAPLKLIFEHLLLVIPKTMKIAKV